MIKIIILLIINFACCMDWWLLFIHASWLNLASFVGEACSIFERFGHSESEEPNVAGLTGGDWWVGCNVSMDSTGRGSRWNCIMLTCFWGIWWCIWRTIHIDILAMLLFMWAQPMQEAKMSVEIFFQASQQCAYKCVFFDKCVWCPFIFKII